MDFTKKSIFLMDHFAKSECVSSTSGGVDANTTNTLSTLYNDIHNGYKHVAQIREPPNVHFGEINTIQEIPFPKKFPASSFPDEIRNHINESSQYFITYKTKQFGRNITFHFVTENFSSSNVDMCVEYSKNMLVWLYIINQYASSKCAKDLIVYLYMTKLQKKLPQSNLHILGENHVNTAFTTSCPVDSEIVIFRKEEWFKVFIHETFHNFALDFSDMNVSECHSKILETFQVKSDVNLFESYAEFWAELINVCFVSYLTCDDNTNKRAFIEQCRYYLDLETKFNAFQLVKALGFMGMTYSNMYKKTTHAQALRDTLYKEDTNVLAYYIIKTVLLANYPAFLGWCMTNNTSLLQFKKTQRNQMEFCKFIDSHYKSRGLLRLIACEENHLSKLIQKRHRTVKKKRDNNYILHTMRMTTCELG